MAYLPRDVIDKILGYLVRSDTENAHVNLHAFASTCKSWRSALHEDAPAWHEALLCRFGVVDHPPEPATLHPFHDRIQTDRVRISWANTIERYGLDPEPYVKGARGLYLAHLNLFGDLPWRGLRRMTRSWQRITSARAGGTWHHIAGSLTKYDSASELCRELWRSDHDWYVRFVSEETRAALRNEDSPFGKRDEIYDPPDEQLLEIEVGDGTNAAGDAKRGSLYNRSLRSVAGPMTKQACEDFCALAIEDGPPGDKRPLKAMHPSAQLMFRLHDGQAQVEKLGEAKKHLKQLTLWGLYDQPQDEDHVFGKEEMQAHYNGLLGGYCVYDVEINTRLLSLANSYRFMQLVRKARNRSGAKGLDLPLTCSADMRDSSIYINAKTGKVWSYVRDQSGQKSGIFAHPPGMDVVDWFEEFSRRVGFGIYAVEREEMSDWSLDLRQQLGDWRPTYLCQFPALSRAALIEAPDPTARDAIERQEVTMYEAISKNAVRVGVSTVYIPFNDMWTYRVRMSLLSIAEQESRWMDDNPSEESRLANPFRPVKEVQLTRRLWIITDADGHEERVEGEAVIGQYPILEPGGRPFSYQSQTNLPGGGPGTMSGGFYFVEGTIERPTGSEFFAKCPYFMLTRPRFMF